MRAKSQAASANNPWLANGVSALVTGTIGAGITPQSMVADQNARAAVGKAFLTWTMVADADGRTDLYGLQSLVERARVVDGESIVHMIATETGLRLRVLPAAALDNTYNRNLPDGGRISEGVEFNAAGQRVAYWAP